MFEDKDKVLGKRSRDSPEISHLKDFMTMTNANKIAESFGKNKTEYLFVPPYLRGGNGKVLCVCTFARCKLLSTLGIKLGTFYMTN